MILLSGFDHSCPEAESSVADASLARLGHIRAEIISLPTLYAASSLSLRWAFFFFFSPLGFPCLFSSFLEDSFVHSVVLLSMLLGGPFLRTHKYPCRTKGVAGGLNESTFCLRLQSTADISVFESSRRPCHILPRFGFRVLCRHVYRFLEGFHVRGALDQHRYWHTFFFSFSLRERTTS